MSTTSRIGFCAACILALFGATLFSCSKGHSQGPVSGEAKGAERQGGERQGGAGQAGGGAGGAGGRRASVIAVQATTVVEGELIADRNTAGVVVPVMQSQVATQTAGVVKSVLRTAGDWVKADEIVVQLDDAQLKLSLANAEAALQNAKINLAIGQDNSNSANPKLELQVQSAQSALASAQRFYDSQKALFDLGGISASALDTAASQLATAKANLEGAKSSLDQNAKSGDQTIAQLRLSVVQAQNQVAQAQLNLRNASIRAPFAGQISAVNMQSGMYAGLNTPVFTLVSPGRQITFSIAPSDAPALPLGRAISFSYNGKTFPIKVAQAPSAPIAGVVPMVASVPPSFDLPFGTVGSVAYRLTIANGMLVPLNALDTVENGNVVFKIVEGKAVTQRVTILGEAGIMTAVAGLNAGDVVVVNPPPGLIQGSAVQAVMLESGAGNP